MNPDLDPATDLSFTRTLAVPRQLLWECWTEPRHIPHFFVPAPHKVTAVEMDVRVGGRFNTTFEVEGEAIENKGVYLEVVPGEKLVFTDGYAEGWKPAAEPFMTAILLLEDAPGGGTTYTAIARHRNPDTRKAHEEMGFFDGWGTGRPSSRPMRRSCARRVNDRAAPIPLPGRNPGPPAGVSLPQGPGKAPCAPPPAGETTDQKDESHAETPSRQRRLGRAPRQWRLRPDSNRACG